MKLPVSRPSQLLIRSGHPILDWIRTYRFAESARTRRIYRLTADKLAWPTGRRSARGRRSDRLDNDRIVRLDSRRNSAEVRMRRLPVAEALVGLKAAVAARVASGRMAEPVVRQVLEVVGVLSEEVLAVGAARVASCEVKSNHVPSGVGDFNKSPI
jgi:hypothetical protein